MEEWEKLPVLIFMSVILTVHNLVFLYGILKRPNWFFYPEKSILPWFKIHAKIRTFFGDFGLITYGAIQLLGTQLIYWYSCFDILS